MDVSAVVESAPARYKSIVWIVAVVIFGASLGANQQSIKDDMHEHETADTLLHAQQATQIVDLGKISQENHDALDAIKSDMTAIKQMVCDTAKHPSIACQTR